MADGPRSEARQQSFWLQPEVSNDLRALSEEEGTSMSKLVNRAIRELVARAKRVA